MSIKQKLLVILCAAAVLGFVALGINEIVSTKQKVQFTEVKLKDKETEHKQLNAKYESLNKELETTLQQKQVDQAEVERLQKEKAELERQNQELQARRAAKATLASVSTPVSSTVASRPQAAGATSGNCYQWLIEAGVADMASAVELQARENRPCNPQQYNMQGSDACGVAQELPCGKSGCGLPPNADGACQIRWMNGYVIGRYGSWANALAEHTRKGWY